MRREYKMNQKGIALVTSLILTMAVMIMATGVLFFINQSTTLSSAGKRYATSGEASDGAVDIVKDTINQTLYGSPTATGLFPSVNCLNNAILVENSPCTVNITLPNTMNGAYQANITLTRLYSKALAGGRLEFARSAGGAPSTAVYYRITTVVTGPDNTSAENSVLYRFAG
jgi:hypothetical protein